MTYEQIFDEIKENFKKAKISSFTAEFAFQFNITGEGEGIFYAAYKNGVLSIEPYDYRDNDAVFAADAKTLIDISAGTLEPSVAVNSGKLFVDGNRELAKQLIYMVNSDKNSQNESSTKTEPSQETVGEEATVVKKDSARAKNKSASAKRSTKRSKAKRGSK